jgi:hypothetical protein
MKELISNATLPILTGEATGVDPDIYLEIEPQGLGRLFRLPVQLNGLSAKEVVLKVIELPQSVLAVSLLNQSGIIHLAPDGFSKDVQFRTRVVWLRQVENGSCHYLLGLELKGADFRFRRSLKNLLARPKDISAIWNHWDQVQIKAVPADARFIVYLCVIALLVGAALQFILPDLYKPLANILILSGCLAIAGKSLWHWWRERDLSRGC